mgnify:CR=1 FL=1
MLKLVKDESEVILKDGFSFPNLKIVISSELVKKVPMAGHENEKFFASIFL